jgi:UDP-N-acetylmuramate dehydrogenase
MDDLSVRRKKSQPLEFPSAGSVFKRPPGAYAAALIERCSLKGKTIGGAQVSEKHAGFVINTGNATAGDILRLAAEVRKRVMDISGVALEMEVRTVGED